MEMEILEAKALVREVYWNRTFILERARDNEVLR